MRLQSPGRRPPRIGALILKISATVFLAACVGCITLLIAGACAHATPRMPTEQEKVDLAQWWRDYQKNFIAADGRVVRPGNRDDTVSEGQAYALLYAALLDDRQTFDRVRDWTRKNLSRKEKFGDHLLAWHWREGAVLDWNSASDANLDYALALLLAYRRWKEDALKDEALVVAHDVLAKETQKTAIGELLLPGTWGAQEDGGCIVNPSYFSPATFRMLHQATGDERWRKLREVSYTLWAEAGRQMGEAPGIGLPPDWCELSPDGYISAAKGRSAGFGWEAMRVPMRAGLDTLLTGERRGRRYLQQSIVHFFRQDFRRARPHAAAAYAHWGAPADPSESLAMSAMALFAFQSAAMQPPFALSYSFERQRRDKRFARDYYAQSMLFYPLAWRAGVFASLAKLNAD